MLFLIFELSTDKIEVTSSKLIEFYMFIREFSNNTKFQNARIQRNEGIIVCRNSFQARLSLSKASWLRLVVTISFKKSNDTLIFQKKFEIIPREFCVTE